MSTLGETARKHYTIIIDDPAEVARQMKRAMPKVKENRRQTGDFYSFNWSIKIAQIYSCRLSRHTPIWLR